jgi:hypothetical protein
MSDFRCNFPGHFALESKLASIVDLGNTYCREHQLPETKDNPKHCIEQLAWELTKVKLERDELKVRLAKYGTSFTLLLSEKEYKEFINSAKELS